MEYNNSSVQDCSSQVRAKFSLAKTSLDVLNSTDLFTLVVLRCLFEELVTFQTFTPFSLAACRTGRAILWSNLATSNFSTLVCGTVFLEKCGCLSRLEFQRPAGGHSCESSVCSRLQEKRIQNHT